MGFNCFARFCLPWRSNLTFGLASLALTTFYFVRYMQYALRASERGILDEGVFGFNDVVRTGLFMAVTHFYAMVGGSHVRSISHWSPYDRVGVVNADP